jgi:hypothetical protein
MPSSRASRSGRHATRSAACASDGEQRDCGVTGRSIACAWRWERRGSPRRRDQVASRSYAAVRHRTQRRDPQAARRPPLCCAGHDQPGRRAADVGDVGRLRPRRQPATPPERCVAGVSAPSQGRLFRRSRAKREKRLQLHDASAETPRYLNGVQGIRALPFARSATRGRRAPSHGNQEAKGRNHGAR